MRGFSLLAQAELNRFLGAIVFLTRLPVSSFYRYQWEESPRYTLYFPLVGALIGGAGGVVLIAKDVMPASLAVLGSMLTTVLLTGGLHEDGIADACDGLLGGFSRQRCIEIMGDSRIGSYGAIALWFSLTAKFVLLVSLLAIDLWRTVLAVIVSHTLGRAATVVLIARMNYVKRAESKSAMFGDRVKAVHLYPALLMAVILSIGLLQFDGMICLGSAVFMTILCGLYYYSKIQGITGDCLGATNQMVELSCYIGLLLAHAHKIG